MRRLPALLLLLLLLPALAAATKIYKHVAPDGTVTYSDQPIAASDEEVVLPPLSVVETEGEAAARRPATPASAGEEREDQPFRYQDLRIVAPEQEESFFGPAGPVAVTVQIAPALAEGHFFRYFLDDRQVAETRTPFLSLQDLYRGEHNIRAEVIDEEGQVRMRAEPVTFYILRPSIAGG